jgi:signal transduction histidine kinase/CHASE3 domain sensor protein
MLFSTRIAKIIFTITALALLVLSTVLSVQISDLERAYKSISGTTEIMLGLEQAITYTKDAETAQRGFLITKDSLFLQPYWKSFERANQRISVLKDLVKNNAEQKQNLDKLEDFIRASFASIDASINEYGMQESPSERRKILLRGKALMDSIRKQGNKMQNLETRILHEKKLEKIRHELMAPVMGFLLIFLSLAILAGSYYKITQDLKRSKDYLAQMKILNEELIEKNRQLEISNEELDSFNYISSHDLQEPVRKIRTFISMIESSDYDKLSEKNKYNFQRLQNAAVRIQDLLNDLLNYSQIGKGEQKLSDVDLNNILEETKSNFEDKIGEANATIQADILPTIQGIPFQLQQLFDNLISNSIKYRHSEKPLRIEIKHAIVSTDEVPKLITALPATKYHRISFSDNGVGFSQEYADKIFEPFSRLFSNHEYPGTGIGLTICKKIANNHHGMIEATGRLNEGATFNIYLPEFTDAGMSHL